MSRLYNPLFVLFSTHTHWPVWFRHIWQNQNAPWKALATMDRGKVSDVTVFAILLSRGLPFLIVIHLIDQKTKPVWVHLACFYLPFTLKTNLWILFTRIKTCTIKIQVWTSLVPMLCVCECYLYCVHLQKCYWVR